jgi:hypothetical protein
MGCLGLGGEAPLPGLVGLDEPELAGEGEAGPEEHVAELAELLVSALYIDARVTLDEHSGGFLGHQKGGGHVRVGRLHVVTVDVGAGPTFPSPPRAGEGAAVALR